VAPLLTRLFAEADAAASPEFARIPRAERERLLRSRTEYLDLYSRMKDLWIPVSPETGALLYILARGSKARTIVEFGTSFGLSTIHLASALRDNGGGRVITTEFEPSKIERARTHIEEAGLSDLVEIREGDALETLSRDLPETIDLLLLDGAKALYSDVLDRVADRLRPGALVVADNADYCPDYLERVRAGDGQWLSTPFADDVELSVRLG